jgi:hypothetical protein
MSNWFPRDIVEVTGNSEPTKVLSLVTFVGVATEQKIDSCLNHFTCAVR